MEDRSQMGTEVLTLNANELWEKVEPVKVVEVINKQIGRRK